jgi:hypothetical protein
MRVSEKPPLKEETRAPVAPEPNVPRRKYALTLLKSLFSSQFEEVVFIYNMPNAYLPTNVSQVEKAITLIQYAEQREGEAISELTLIQYAEQREGEAISELLNTIYTVHPDFRRGR